MRLNIYFKNNNGIKYTIFFKKKGKEKEIHKLTI